MESIKAIEPILKNNDFKTLARSISIVENEVLGYQDLLMQLQPNSAKIIGITGAPGAGKSSLTDALIGHMVKDGKKVGVLCVDPSSPFNKGALLGDRIRMSEWYNHPNVFIRSLATRGALGGLHPKIIEIADVMKGAGFDYIIIETVGVGQSEVDIAGLAEITVVMLVPEGGDVIQTMKAGLMEVADIFVVNKFDRPGAEIFYNQLKKMLVPDFHNRKQTIPIVKTVASSQEGIGELYKLLNQYQTNQFSDNKVELMAQKVWTLMQKEKMKGVDINVMKKKLASELLKENFNLYRFARKFTEG